MNQSNWVGVDTHKETLACYKEGRFKEFKTNKKGFEAAIKWAGEDSLWAIEGAYCFGRPFSVYLTEKGCKVYEVNPLFTKTCRSILSVTNPKNDYGDAKVISMFADKAKLQEVSLETIKLKEVLTVRRLAVKQRSSITASIKMLYSTRGIELPFADLTTIKAGKWLLNQDDIVIRSYAVILNALNTTIKELEKDIKKNLPEKAHILTELKGIKELTAAIMYTETKGKLLSPEALASYAGIAPVENSSGKTKKFKNNKKGNRKLNSVFFRLSLHQSINDTEGKKYYEKKLAEGKTPRHARKCLSRRLVNIVFKLLSD